MCLTSYPKHVFLAGKIFQRERNQIVGVNSENYLLATTCEPSLYSLRPEKDGLIGKFSYISQVDDELISATDSDAMAPGSRRISHYTDTLF